MTPPEGFGCLAQCIHSSKNIHMMHTARSWGFNSKRGQILLCLGMHKKMSEVINARRKIKSSHNECLVLREEVELLK